MAKSGQKELIIGAFTLAAAATELAIVFGWESILYSLIICILSAASYYLYTMPTRHSRLLLFIKIAGNAVFNIFLFPLLVMSWTLLRYKKPVEKHEDK